MITEPSHQVLFQRLRKNSDSDNDSSNGNFNTNNDDNQHHDRIPLAKKKTNPPTYHYMYRKPIRLCAVFHCS